MSELRLLLPAGLIALISLPLIYLFHMRSPTPKSARVPSLRFWHIASPRPTEEPRFRRPPLTFDLLVHLLIATLLAFALARPVTDAFAGSLGQRGDPIHQIILLDGSTSMGSYGSIVGKSRFEEAKTAAAERIESLRAGDAVTVVLFGSRISTRSASDPAAVSQLRSDLGSWQAPGGEADLTAALLLAGDLRMPGIANRLLLLSDGALAADPAAVAATGMQIEDQRFGPPGAANFAITAIARRNHPSRPAAGQLLVTIANFSAAPATATLNLLADGVPVFDRDVALGANERRVELFDLPSNTGSAMVRITPGDSQPMDDVATIQLDGGGFGSLNVLIFSDQPDPLARAFGALPGSRVSVETTDAALNGMGTSGFDLVVYDQVIPSSAPVSPALFVMPPDSNYFRSPAMLASSTIASSVPGDPLLNGVDLTGVVLGVTPRYALPEGFVVPVAASDGPLVAYGTLADLDVPVALLAMPLDAGNLTERIAFPILIANLAAWLAPLPPPAIVQAGDPITLSTSAAAHRVIFTVPGGDTTILPAPPVDAGERTVSFAATGEPGIYLIEEFDADDVLLTARRVSVNAGSSAESDLRARAGLAENLAQGASVDDAGASGDRVTELWPFLALLAAVLVIVEWAHGLRAARRVPVSVSGGAR